MLNSVMLTEARPVVYLTKVRHISAYLYNFPMERLCVTISLKVTRKTYVKHAINALMRKWVI